MDSHINKDCMEFVVHCRGGCDTYYKRRFQEVHVCIPKEDNSAMVLHDCIKELKNVNLKLEMDCKAVQSQLMSVTEKKQELEVQLIKCRTENEDLSRRLETIQTSSEPAPAVETASMT